MRNGLLRRRSNDLSPRSLHCLALACPGLACPALACHPTMKKSKFLAYFVCFRLFFLLYIDMHICFPHGSFGSRHRMLEQRQSRAQLHSGCQREHTNRTDIACCRIRAERAATQTAKRYTSTTSTYIYSGGIALTRPTVISPVAGSSEKNRSKQNEYIVLELVAGQLVLDSHDASLQKRSCARGGP